MEDEGPDNEVTQVLTLLQAGLEKAEATMSRLLSGIVADNAVVVSELEAALSHAEAALAAD
ncbi:MAG: hypothetical protein OEY41_02860 [Acidimicrobiia bacterium]|nr:hypothetical protein [Acidimicrobiia bacterium]MDH5288919.1 hypothetical protein [Acidimicrobiia bacterium]